MSKTRKVLRWTCLPKRTVPMAEMSGTQLWHRLKSHAVEIVQSVDVLHFCCDALTGPGIGMSTLRRRAIPRSLSRTAKCFAIMFAVFV